MDCQIAAAAAIKFDTNPSNSSIFGCVQMFARVRAQKELYQFTSSNTLGDMHVSNACSVRRIVDLCEART